jgi:hypothetical protein
VNIIKLTTKKASKPPSYRINAFYIDPITADTSLKAKAVQYERKAGLAGDRKTRIAFKYSIAKPMAKQSIR